jgi:hypothetical protein
MQIVGIAADVASASVQPLATVFSVSALIRAFTRASSAVWLKRVPPGKPTGEYRVHPIAGVGEGS